MAVRTPFANSRPDPTKSVMTSPFKVSDEVTSRFGIVDVEGFVTVRFVSVVVPSALLFMIVVSEEEPPVDRPREIESKIPSS